MFKNQLIVMHS